MPRRGNFVPKQPKKAQIEAMARKQANSFEPDLLGEIKYRNAEDPYAENNVEPLTAAELRENDQMVEKQRRLLTKALEPGGNDAQLAPFTGSVVDKVILIAKEAVALGAPGMAHADWMAEVHEVLYDRHLPFSAQAYQIFRIAAKGDLRDPDVVRFLMLQRMIEKGKITKETSDKLGGAHTAITKMYGQMRQDVEKARETAAAAAATVAITAGEPAAAATEDQIQLVKAEDTSQPTTDPGETAEAANDKNI